MSINGIDLGIIVKPSLGGAIIASAINDFRFSLDRQEYLSAERFLWPTSPEQQEHFHNVVNMCNADKPEEEHVSESWLRERLDRARPIWGKERTEAASSKADRMLSRAYTQQHAAGAK